MISNQILQNTIDGLKGISKVDFSVLDAEGKELASTLDNAQERNSAVIVCRIACGQSGNTGMSVF